MISRSEHRGSLHLMVARAADRIPLWRPPALIRPLIASDLEAGSLSEADPETRVFYVRSVAIAWIESGLLSIFLMLGLALIGDFVDGASGRRIGLAVGLGIAFFSVAGAFYAIWRECFAYLARHRARKYGLADRRYRRAAKRSELHNSSVALQAVVGALAIYLTLR